MSLFDGAVFGVGVSPKIDATVQANVFHNILDVCDNTITQDVANVTYYVMWGVSFEDVFEVSGSQVAAGTNNATRDNILPVSNHTIYGLASSNTSRTIEELIEQSISDSTRANRLIGYIVNDTNKHEAKLDPSMNLPDFPEQTVYIYSSIPPKSGNNLDDFSLFREGLYFGISVNNWLINIVNVRKDNVQEDVIAIDDIKNSIKLSNGEDISGNIILEMGFVINKNTNFIRTDASSNSTLLQEHYEYCAGLYDIHLHVSGGLVNRQKDYNTFQVRRYHIGSETVKREVLINQTNKSSVLTIGNGTSETIHYILQIKPSADQLNISTFNLT